MSLRSDVSQAGRDAVPADGARLQHVLQVGTTIRTIAHWDRTHVIVKANKSEMQEVLQTAVAESLELIRGREIGRDSTIIGIEAMNTKETFDITVHLEQGGRKALVRGVMEKYGFNQNSDPHTLNNSEKGLVANMEAYVMISQGEDFRVTYWRKPDKE